VATGKNHRTTPVLYYHQIDTTATCVACSSANFSGSTSQFKFGLLSSKVVRKPYRLPQLLIPTFLERRGKKHERKDNDKPSRVHDRQPSVNGTSPALHARSLSSLRLLEVCSLHTGLASRPMAGSGIIARSSICTLMDCQCDQCDCCPVLRLAVPCNCTYLHAPSCKLTS